jgi:phospholipid transport system substrate-binding protein
MRRLITFLIITLASCVSVYADDVKDAEKLLKGAIDEVVAVLNKEDIEADQKKDKVKEIVSPLFDFPLMAKLSLGKKVWFKLKAEEQEKFTDLFIKRIKDSYIEKMIRYTNEEILFETPSHEERKIEIPTVLISNGNRYAMLYKMYNSKKGLKIYDLEVQGVSLVKSYRSQFEEVLKEGTINDIMLKLNEAAVN